MAIGSTSFPGSIDTVYTLLTPADQARTVLTSGIGVFDTTLTVTSTAGFPDQGVVTINREHITYTARTATTFVNCVRGAFQGDGGVAAISHASGSVVQQLIIAAYHRVHTDAIMAIESKLGSGASTPATNTYLAGGPDGTSSWQSLPISPTGATGPTGAAVTQLYGNGTLVGQSGQIDLINGGEVQVIPMPADGKVQVALPRGATGPTGPAGPLGIQGRMASVEGTSGTLGASGGSQLTLTMTCPGGYLPVSMHYQVPGDQTGARFISMQTIVDLATRQITMKLTRSSGAIDTAITTHGICMLASTS